MQLLTSLSLAAATLATLITAQNPFSFNTQPIVTAGVPFQITWSPSTGTTDTVTLLLKQGPPAQLNTVLTIASKIVNVGSYAWAVPSTLPKGDNYTFEIIDDGNTAIVNYSIQFSVDAPATAAGASPSPSTASGQQTSATGSAATAATSASGSATAAAKSGAVMGRKEMCLGGVGMGMLVLGAAMVGL